MAVITRQGPLVGPQDPLSAPPTSVCFCLDGLTADRRRHDVLMFITIM